MLLVSVDVTDEQRTSRRDNGDIEVRIVLPDIAEPAISDQVAERIRDARKRRGWKTAELAARCNEIGGEGITENIIENIEGGRRAPDGRRRRLITVGELVMIAAALGMPVALLLPELAQEAGDLHVLNGIDDTIAGLEAAKNLIADMQARRAERTSGS